MRIVSYPMKIYVQLVGVGAMGVVCCGKPEIRIAMILWIGYGHVGEIAAVLVEFGCSNERANKT